MRKRNTTYIFMCLLACALFTSCGASAGEKTDAERRTVNIKSTQTDADVKKDTSTGLDSGSEDVAVSEENASDAEDSSDAGTDTEDYHGDKYSVYNNPIDEYYRPRIYSWDASEIEIRAAQDAYRKVWKQEFQNLIKWLKKKCVYEEDRENIIALEKNVARQVKIGREVCEVEMLDAYEVPFAGSGEGYTRMSLPGNGTRSALNQMEGEIYRDASMRILLHSVGYEFRNIDYSKVTADK